MRRKRIVESQSLVHSFIGPYLVSAAVYPQLYWLASLAESRRSIDIISLSTKYKNQLFLEACRSTSATIYPYPPVCQMVVTLRGCCISRLTEACYLMFCVCGTFNSPSTLGCRLRVSDPILPKDLRLFYVLDRFSG